MLAKKIPFIRAVIQKELDRALKDIHHAVHKEDLHMPYEKRLPRTGIPLDAVSQRARSYKSTEVISWEKGYVSGGIYGRDSQILELSTKMFKDFAWTNPLHADVFPDIRRMEAEVVRMCLSMFHGDEEACGTMTSGGTESIMLACLAYRELAREKGIQQPNMIVPVSAHAAFDKASHYFNIELIHIAVDPVTQKVDIIAMKNAINSNTCMLVGSAPGFPHGIIDPIGDIAKLGAQYNIPVHVDCCLGGFLLPFMDEVDFPIEPFDFRLPGVTSISCDTHKYAFTVKGSSIIMYRNKDLRAKQFFVQPNWPGGIYASATFAGSRPGVLIAACWATMLYQGHSGYCESTRRIVTTTRYIASELKKIPGIFIYGEPEVCVVAFGSNVFDIYTLAERLSDMPNGHKWCLNNLQFPHAVHICITDRHTDKDWADRFIRDVASVVKELMSKPRTKSTGTAAMYGMSQLIPDRTLIRDLARGYLDACYDTPTYDLPKQSQNHK